MYVCLTEMPTPKRTNKEKKRVKQQQWGISFPIENEKTCNYFSYIVL